MLSIRMDADGAKQLAKQLEIALAVEGVKASEQAVRNALASLMRMNSWTSLQRKAKEQLLNLSYGIDPTDLLHKTMLHTVMELADAAMAPVHPNQLSDLGGSEATLSDQPLLVQCSCDDPPRMKIHFNGVAADHNLGMFGETSTLISSDPVALGHMLASVLCKEIYLGDCSMAIADLVDVEIEHNPETGEDEITDTESEDDDQQQQPCPHCRATARFIHYARFKDLPAPDEQFPAMEMGEMGEFTVFSPYVDQELMFCMVEDEALTWLPTGTILPVRWSTDLLDIISGMQGLPPIEVGQEVMILFGMIEWPTDHFMNGIPERGVVKSLSIETSGARRAKIKVEGQRKLLAFPVDCLIPV